MAESTDPYVPQNVPATDNPELERFLAEELDRISNFLAGIESVVNLTNPGVNKFGRNPDIDTGGTEDIWDGGGTYTFATSASVQDVVSASASDTSAGLGARTIRIEGLDANFDPLSEDVTMNGTTIVTTTSAFLRVFRAYVIDSGNLNFNAGDITIRVTGGGIRQAVILAGNAQTGMAIYTVPRGRTAYMTSFTAVLNRTGVTSGAQAKLTMITQDNADSDAAIRVRQFFGLAIDGNSEYRQTFAPYKVFTEKTDISFRCDDVSDNNTDVSVSFDLILE